MCLCLWQIIVNATRIMNFHEFFSFFSMNILFRIKKRFFLRKILTMEMWNFYLKYSCKSLRKAYFAENKLGGNRVSLSARGRNAETKTFGAVFFFFFHVNKTFRAVFLRVFLRWLASTVFSRVKRSFTEEVKLFLKTRESRRKRRPRIFRGPRDVFSLSLSLFLCSRALSVFGATTNFRGARPRTRNGI